MKTYLVGGAVRDKAMCELHGTAVHTKDRDWVVVGSTADEMLAQGFKKVGVFPVFLHPQTKEEYALARKERKDGKGHKGFKVDFSPQVTLEEDLLRRDLTINAMAENTETGEVIDPYGGMNDLKNCVLRHVSPAFVEDPLRVLRVARFAARFPNFSVANETMTEMRRIVDSGELDELTPERVWNEIESGCAEGKPSRFFEILSQCGGLRVILPEIDALLNTGDEKAFMACVNRAATTNQSVVVWATACHMLMEITDGSLQSVKAMIKTIGERLKAPKRYTDLALVVSEYHEVASDALRSPPKRILELLEASGSFKDPNLLYLFLKAFKAIDERGENQSSLLLAAYKAASPVQGKMFLEEGHKPGPQIGTLVNEKRAELIALEQESATK